jgi:threonine synthase
MKLRNIKHPDQLVTFREAVMSGLGKDRGLFFPERIRPLQDIEHLLSQDFVARSTVVGDPGV